METANHSMEMEKRQIAISSSSKRDKGTFPKDTPVLSLQPVTGKAATDQPDLSLRLARRYAALCAVEKSGSEAHRDQISPLLDPLEWDHLCDSGQKRWYECNLPPEMNPIQFLH
ncbi:hypothetical protein G5714_005523 [Onychostoma macrolepis]|uniref:Uncharacterized protein n=1 Tax=Onychostoma macrolepis TaxID=369639 RepID=A0A7J6D194_9TELE|nr:hypothetical protein G5714_005523 [Onychostoma macrolepis]